MSEDSHRACVDSWMDRAVRHASRDEAIDAFDAAFKALWKRAQVTLGDVTLAAIVDRVIWTAIDEMPGVQGLAVGLGGLDTTALRTKTALEGDALAGAIHFVLLEFLTVLGNLTAEILSPPLHAALLDGWQETSKS